VSTAPRFTYEPESRTLLAGDVRLPVVEANIEDWPEAGPRVGVPPHRLLMQTRQAIVGCENGWRLSVIWGTGTWSTNHGALWNGEEFQEEPLTVEVAVLPPGGGLLGPLSNVEPAVLVALSGTVSALPSDPSVIDMDGLALVLGT
jgi:hypothetical protein